MKSRKKRTPMWIRIVSGTSWVLICALCLGAGSLAGYMGQGKISGQAMHDLFTKGRASKVGDADVFEGRDGTNILLLGCDVDLATGGKKVLQRQARSDMMLVAHLDFKTNKITGLSIQRDTLVALPGYREQKINSYHAMGVRKSDEEGKEMAKQAVESIPDLAFIPKDLEPEEFRELIVLDTFDMLSPEYDNPQRISDVARMFERSGADVTFAGFIDNGTASAAVVRAVKRSR